jgi:5-(carboxyamino)imidazole ribonucleotide mutase
MKVAILMGSPNDKDKMAPALATLQELGVDAEEHVMSAHRTPAAVADFARSARQNGYAALICGAGMAAHLAGAVAANTTLPVVGVPLSGGALNGVDALYATVQMPRGVPVATVAIDGAMNAALLVAQMLAITDAALAARLDERRAGPQAGHGVQATQAGHGVQATQAGHGVQATQAGHGVQATQAGQGVQATQAGQGVQATQAGQAGGR